MTRHILAVASATLLFIVLGYPPAPPSTHYSWGWQRDIRKRSVLESRLYRDKHLIAASNTLLRTHLFISGRKKTYFPLLSFFIFKSATLFPIHSTLKRSKVRRYVPTANEIRDIIPSTLEDFPRTHYERSTSGHLYTDVVHREEASQKHSLYFY